MTSSFTASAILIVSSLLANSALAQSSGTTTTTSTINSSSWTTLSVTGTPPPNAITDYTTDFGIAVVQIPTTSSSASSSIPTTTLESSSASSSSVSATPTADIDYSSYIKANVSDTEGTLKLTLQGSILKDSAGRIGSIVANRQFQFDGPPPQAGALYAKGWSITEDGYLAIGANDTFYQCLSGTFYNLYDQSIGEQCVPIHLEAVGLI